MNGQPRFLTTRWSLVLRAQGDTGDARRALGELYGRYWYPLYAHARRRGLDEHPAADLVQSYFADLLRRGDLERVHASRGRFRSWLLAGIHHAHLNELAREKHAVTISVEALADGERRFQAEPAAEPDAEREWNRRWALQVLEHAVGRLERECADAGRSPLFEALFRQLRLGAPPQHEQLAAQLGLKAPNVRVQAHRLRKRFGELIRAEIADTVEDEQDVEAELQELLRGLE